VVALVALALGLAAGYTLGRRMFKTVAVSAPLYHQLTFRRGAIRAARFAPDGQTIVYSAAWQGNPVEVFTARREFPESRSLGLSQGHLFAAPRAERAARVRNFHFAAGTNEPERGAIGACQIVGRARCLFERFIDGEQRHGLRNRTQGVEFGAGGIGGGPVLRGRD